MKKTAQKWKKQQSNIENNKEIIENNSYRKILENKDVALH